MTEADLGPIDIHFSLDPEEHQDMLDLQTQFEVNDIKDLYHGLGLGLLRWGLDLIVEGKQIGAYDEETQTVRLLNLDEFNRIIEKVRKPESNGT